MFFILRFLVAWVKQFIVLVVLITNAKFAFDIVVDNIPEASHSRKLSNVFFMLGIAIKTIVIS